MELNRRKFLELMGCTTTAMVFPSLLKGAGVPEQIKLALALQAQANSTPVIWFQGQSCAGCSISTMNSRHPDIADVLTKMISLEFHPNIMGGTGELAKQVLELATENKGGFVLVVEGSIPTGENANYCSVGERNGHPISAEEWIRKLGAAAQAVLAVGTCSSFGGIPAAAPNPTGAKPVSELLPEATIVNIPGCPSHPDWVIGTIAHVLLFGMPELDDKKRPKMFFSKVVHEQCERRADFEDGLFAEDFGQDGCMFELGCKGTVAHCDCSIRGWNNRVNWCIRSGSPCIGCVEPEFPDFGNDGLYSQLPIEKTYGIDWIGHRVLKGVLDG